MLLLSAVAMLLYWLEGRTPRWAWTEAWPAGSKATTANWGSRIRSGEGDGDSYEGSDHAVLDCYPIHIN
uniref:Uncharacterized protein n=1 Tax=Oryza nivara TaxID=4536 RepID=A0A0E0HBB6_ORYNI